MSIPRLAAPVISILGSQTPLILLRRKDHH
jgi:hypothetical protein